MKTLIVISFLILSATLNAQVNHSMYNMEILTESDELVYYVPNAFTPDGDSYNQTFQPVFTTGFDPYDFHLQIYNRWGEIVFESKDYRIGWDGSYGSKGQFTSEQNDVFVYVIEFKRSINDERIRTVGHVNILL